MRSLFWIGIGAMIAAVAGGAVRAEEAGEAKTDPKGIWPAGLKEYEGRYVYVQIASPGGLWERYTPATPNAATVARQVSMNEVPAALREKLTHAEIVIAGVQAAEVDASEVVSPSKRGKLRYYQETAEGTLTVRNLPGLSGVEDAPDDYTGRAALALEHQSHSNPSVSGILFQRDNQEVTWGTSTLDYADLTATPIRPEAKEDEEPLPVVGNARVLRSAREIFAYVEWTQTGDDGTRVYSGCVRLRRAEDTGAAAEAPKPGEAPQRPSKTPIRPTGEL